MAVDVQLKGTRMDFELNEIFPGATNEKPLTCADVTAEVLITLYNSPPPPPPGAVGAAERSKCTGCTKQKPQECFVPCRKKGGYCQACDGTHGTKGACCRKGYALDPPECRTKGVDFK